MVFFLHSFIAREAPILELYPKETQKVAVGQQAALSCRAISGIPSPTIVWKRRDNRPLSHRIKEEYPGYISIDDITVEEAGEYECHAQNIAGSTSLTATINVQQSPVITLDPDTTDLTITEGDELKLECSAVGIPQPSVSWKKDQQPSSSPFSVAPYATIHKYNARRTDEGLYVCVASNDAGIDEKYISVVVQPKRGDIGEFNSNISINSIFV